MRFEFLARGLSLDDARVDIDLTAQDARLLFTRDKDGKPLLVMGDAKAGRMSVESSLDDVEHLLLARAKKGAAAYGLAVDRASLRLKVENERSIRVHLKLSTRVGRVIPAGLHFRARMDIDENLNGRLSGMSCTGDDVLGPLISGLIHPFIKKYNGTTRPLMNFPKTDMRLRDVQIVSGDTIRLSADFGS